MLYELKIKQSDYKKDSDFIKADKQVKELECKLNELKSRNNLNMIKGSLQDIKFTETFLSSCLYRRNRVPIEKGLCEWLKNNLFDIVNIFHKEYVQVHVEYIRSKDKPEFLVYNIIELGKRYNIIRFGERLDNEKSLVYAQFEKYTLFGSNKFDNIYVEFGV